MKKIISLILAIVLASCSVSAFAEDAIQTILSAKTTQAFTQESVSEEDLKPILTTGTSATRASTRITIKEKVSLGKQNKLIKKRASANDPRFFASDSITKKEKPKPISYRN